MHPQLPPTWKSIRTSDSDALQIAYSPSADRLTGRKTPTYLLTYLPCAESTRKGVNSRSKYVTQVQQQTLFSSPLSLQKNRTSTYRRSCNVYCQSRSSFHFVEAGTDLAATVHYRSWSRGLLYLSLLPLWPAGYNRSLTESLCFFEFLWIACNHLKVFETCCWHSLTWRRMLILILLGDGKATRHWTEASIWTEHCIAQWWWWVDA